MPGLLIMQLGFLNLNLDQSPPSIYQRIELALGWLENRWVNITSQQGYYVDPGDEEVSLVDNGYALSALSIYSRVYTSTKYKENILRLMRLMLNSQTAQGPFRANWNTRTGEWSEPDGLTSQDPYIMESLAFTSFQLRYLGESDETLYGAVKAVELCLDRNEENMGEDGGWRLRYLDGGEHVRLSENSAVLVALLYSAMFEKRWGDGMKAGELALKAQKTMRWILSQQDKVEGSWGYGGFYSGDGYDQPFEGNALAVYAITAYLRIIISLTDAPEPSMDEARLSLRTWHDHYLTKMVDEYGGPFFSREKNGVQKYPMETRSAGWGARALVEAWVVLGDRKFRDSADDMYKWLGGFNEMGVDMQLEGGFIRGYSSKDQLDWRQDLSTTSKALLGLIYCNWINIPELPLKEGMVVLALTIFLVAFFRAKTKSALKDKIVRR
ncbi:MAG: hypothetical protein QXO32_01370 [Candidatus Bathyarchaeia archaeon]